MYFLNLTFVDPCIIVQFIKKNPTRRNNISKFYYSIFIWSSTCFGRHTAHHQDPKTALAASGFFYTWKVIGRVVGGRCQAHVQQPSTYEKPEAASAVLGSWWWAVCRPKHVELQCAWQRPPATRPTTFHVWKTRGRQSSFRLLMMGCVSPETCSASYKYGIIKFWYIVASCWIFLYELHFLKLYTNLSM